MVRIDRFDFKTTSLEDIRSLKHKKNKVGEDWPVVYVINGKDKAYVGQTTNAARRVNDHLGNPVKKKLTDIRIISDDDFNVSVVLDLESYLIAHMSADRKYTLLNGNNGLQDHDYYDRGRYEDKFKAIWKKLHRLGVVQNTISEIENTELFKYSPYKSLGEEQKRTEMEILRAFAEHYGDAHGVTIIVNGGAGTGKTVLAIYLMKLFADINAKGFREPEEDELYDMDAEYAIAAESINGIEKIGIVFPQKSLRESLKDVFKCVESLSPKMVLDTGNIVKDFIKTGEKYDLLIVDEAHRLKCRNRGHLTHYPTFDKSNKALGLDKMEGTELDWIFKCSRNRIIFRDDLQTIRPCDIENDVFWDIIENRYEGTVVRQALETQWRCKGGNDYIEYVRDILSCTAKEFREIENYDFKLYEDPNKMIEDIKALNAKMGLCRTTAGYAWKWKSKKDKQAYDIELKGKKYRWNSTDVKWIESKKSIEEIGCIHTVQGYDLNYLGVIIGEDIKYDKSAGAIYADKTCYHDQQGKSGVANDQDALRDYLTNIYLTLMTRGISGTYVYVCDPALREYMKQFIPVVE